MARAFSLLDAPSNLGLRPPEEGAVPGCYKAPGVLRDFGLHRRLDVNDGGVVTPPRYRADWQPGTVRNEAAIVAYSRQLAGRLEELLNDPRTPVVLGGDCSIMIGIALALNRRGRYGMVSIDGLDYRHPGNSASVGAAGGESLALITGLGGQLADLDQRRPYVRSEDTVAIGFRANDESAGEAARNGLVLIDAEAAGRDPHGAAAEAISSVARNELDGFWIHLDADVIDPALMPAVDSPEPDGLTFEQLTPLLRDLLGHPGAVGLDVTIYDPDRDPDLEHGRRLVDFLVDACS